MTSSKRIIIALFAALIAVLSVLAYGWNLKQENSQAQEDAVRSYGKAVAEIYIANTDIPMGTAIKESQIQKVSWPTALLSQQVVTDPKECIGKKAKTLIQKNEPISLVRVSGTSNDLQIPKGFAAVTVPSDDVQAVGGAIAPGSKVDLYVIVDGKASLLCNSVVVLATSSTPAEEKENAVLDRTPLSWVTLALKEEHVEEILGASKDGSLYLTLPSLGM